MCNPSCIITLDNNTNDANYNANNNTNNNTNNTNNNKPTISSNTTYESVFVSKHKCYIYRKDRGWISNSKTLDKIVVMHSMPIYNITDVE